MPLDTLFDGNAASFISPSTDLKVSHPTVFSSAPAASSFQNTSSADPASTLGNLASSIPDPLNLPASETVNMTINGLPQCLRTLLISEPSDAQIAIHQNPQNWHASQRTDSTMNARLLETTDLQVRSLLSLTQRNRDEQRKRENALKRARRAELKQWLTLPLSCRESLSRRQKMTLYRYLH